jgi:hypothetical protein
LGVFRLNAPPTRSWRIFLDDFPDFSCPTFPISVPIIDRLSLSYAREIPDALVFDGRRHRLFADRSVDRPGAGYRIDTSDAVYAAHPDEGVSVLWWRV